MNEINVKFKDALMPGVIIALITIVLTLIFQFTINDLTTRGYFSYLTLVITLGVTIYFGIQYRNQYASDGFPYGKAFLLVFYMLLISTLIGTVFNYINWTIIDPGQLELMKEAAAEKIYQQTQLTEEQMEQAIEMQAKYMTPGMSVFWGIFGGVLYSVILALIAPLAFWRKTKINFDEN